MLLRNALTISLGFLAFSGLLACSGATWETPEAVNPEPRARIAERYGTVHGGRGIVLFGPSRRGENGAETGLAVNAYLWRASLETIDFMPLAQTDPFGGVIITDWYSPPETPDERFKLTVYVRDRELRADGLKVSLFRQVRGENGGWIDAPVDPAAASSIEDNILTRAREIRIASLGPAQ